MYTVNRYGVRGRKMNLQKKEERESRIRRIKERIIEIERQCNMIKFSLEWI